ncbi:MAG TPA: hypothetical protein PKE13_19340, partial [Hyphomicrobium zavarzinii]|nr:hypothetical protein [Hyphomicrobium zavarzinii]
LIDMIRLLVTKACDHVAPQRFLVASTKAARDRVLLGWVPPVNSDFMHFGALRGLDGAKEHAGMMVLGRSQWPTDAIDGVAAAFATNDPVAYQPYDSCGTSRTADDKPLYRLKRYRKLRLRNGHEAMREVRTMPWGLGRAVDTSWREEEIRQAIGRLRPVYRRGEPPLVLILGTSTPADIIVDEVFRIEDAVDDAATKAADARRIAGKIVTHIKQIEGPSYQPEHLDLARYVEQAMPKWRAHAPAMPIAEVYARAHEDFAREWRRAYWPVLTWLPE